MTIIIGIIYSSLSHLIPHWSLGEIVNTIILCWLASTHFLELIHMGPIGLYFTMLNVLKVLLVGLVFMV